MNTISDTFFLAQFIPAILNTISDRAYFCHIEYHISLSNSEFQFIPALFHIEYHIRLLLLTYRIPHQTFEFVISVCSCLIPYWKPYHIFSLWYHFIPGTFHIENHIRLSLFLPETKRRLQSKVLVIRQQQPLLASGTVYTPPVKKFACCNYLISGPFLLLASGTAHTFVKKFASRDYLIFGPFL